MQPHVNLVNRTEAGQLLQPADLDRILDLLGSVAGAHESLVVRRRTLLQQLATLVEADIWVWVCLHIPRRGLPVNSNAVDGGWIDEDERTRMYAAVNTPDCHALSTLLDQQVREQDDRLGNHLTVIAAEMSLPVEVHSAHERFMKSVDLGSRLLSIRPRDATASGLFTLNRRIGTAPFTARDRAIVDSVLAHVPWVHQLDSEISSNPDALLKLTQRERQILRLSMVGHGRKEIATLLGVTLYTVTDHFKSMYRKLGVRSQGELLSRFISGEYL